MTPNHHLPEDWIDAYARGEVQSEALQILIASHLALCTHCRRILTDIEFICGVNMEQQSAPIPPTMLEDTLRQLEDREIEQEPNPVEPSASLVLPQPLRDYTGRLDQVPWRWFSPFVEHFELNLTHNELPVRLVKLSPGMTIPHHAHSAPERTLVFTGGFTDASGHYERGDLCVRGPEHTHTQKVDRGEPCVALIVNDGLMVHKTFYGWFLSWFTKV